MKNRSVVPSHGFGSRPTERPQLSDWAEEREWGNEISAKMSKGVSETGRELKCVSGYLSESKCECVSE